MIETNVAASGRRIIGPLVIVLTVFVWVGALEYAIRYPSASLWLAAVAAAAVAGLAASVTRRRPSRRSIILGMAVLFGTTAAVLLFAPGARWQQAVVVVSAVLALMLIRLPDVAHRSELQGRVMMFIMTMVMVFGWAAILSFGVFFSVRWWWLMLMAVVLTGVVAVIVWEDAGAAWVRWRRHLPFVLVLAAEMLLVIWWLPTTVVVGSVVATTMLMLALQIFRHLWLETWKPGRGRRYLIIGVTVVGLVLVTARWV